MSSSTASMRVGQVWRDNLRQRTWTVTRVSEEKAHLRADETVFVVTASVWIDRVLASKDWKLVSA